MSSYSAYFRDGRETAPTTAHVVGILPHWLSGTLFINGPGRFRGMSHLFDGLSLLHAFTLRPGTGGTAPVYQARYLRSKSFLAAEAANGDPKNREFASSPGGFCGRVRTLAAGSSASDNANVALVPFRGALYALTEAPVAWLVDKGSLASIAPWSDAPFSKRSVLEVAATTSAHVLRHDGIPSVLGGRPFAIFLTTRYTLALPPSIVYGSYEISLCSDDAGPPAEERFKITPVAKELPAYMHSFTATATRVVLTEAPMRFSLPAMMHTIAIAPHGTPITNGWPWDASGSVVFRVAELRGHGEGEGAAGGKHLAAKALALRVPGLPFFVLHHVNAWDDAASGGLFVDVVAYDDQDILRDLSLAALRAGKFSSRGAALRRFFLDPRAGIAKEVFLHITPQLPSFELPTVAPSVVGHRHRFIYAIRATPGAFVDALIKADVCVGGEPTFTPHKVWAQRACSPGEPTFVPRPGGTVEDDGVVLALVLAPSAAAAANVAGRETASIDSVEGVNAAADGDDATTFLLVLDAATFLEVARVVLDAGHALPYTFHGLWLRESEDT